MERIKFSDNWKVVIDSNCEFIYDVPKDAKEVSLPFDTLLMCEKDFLNGKSSNCFYHAHTSYFYKKMPRLKKFTSCYLDISGVSGICNVYINNLKIKTIATKERRLIDITKHYDSKITNIIKLVIASFEDTGKYTGNGISESVDILVSYDKGILPAYGTHIITNYIQNKANVTAFIEVENKYSEQKTFTLATHIYNARGKYVVKKQRKVRIKPKEKKIFELNLNIPRPYQWSYYDPYVYTCKTILGLEVAEKEEQILDTDTTEFSIVRKSVVNNNFVLNDDTTKLNGAIMPHDNGILGMVSDYSMEYRRLKEIKNIGYNAVRYVNLPSDSSLKALDNLGLLCVVDIFDFWTQSKYFNDGHLFFEKDYKEITKNAVLSLRNHACCAIYSIGSKAREVYDTPNGIEIAKNIIAIIKEYDKKAIIAINAYEFEPTLYELKQAGYKIDDNSDILKLKEEYFLENKKTIFQQKSMQMYEYVDILTFSDLDKKVKIVKENNPTITNMFNVDNVFDVFKRGVEKADDIGSFIDCGQDYLGIISSNTDNEKDKIKSGAVKEYIEQKGDIDITGVRKIRSLYNEILLSKNNVCYITILDPKELENGNEVLSDTWDFPRYIGQNVTVRVFTNGDIVSLVLDGNQIGRKIAAKENKYYADFVMQYFPGKLEATVFFKGIEHSYTYLQTPANPKQIKLDFDKKSVEAGELCFVDILVTDKNGVFTKKANRLIDIQVDGDGELVLAGSSDPSSICEPFSGQVETFNGRAVAVVKALQDGKINVKASSEGLLSKKGTLKVKSST